MAAFQRHLVVITGAGASVRMGADRPLAMMGGWSDAIVAALGRSESWLPEALHLPAGLTGELFEQTLGELLEFFRTRTLIAKYAQAGRLPRQAGIAPQIFDWLEQIERREQIILHAVNQTLWEEFGLERADIDAATAAYRELCHAVDALPNTATTQLFFASTNYDRIGEEALDGVGFKCDDGARRRRAGGTAYLDLTTMRPWGPELTVPYLHLHGAVGWYRDRQGIRIDPADRPYDPREVPAVLYPDPNKDPYNETDGGVHEVWRIFGDALEGADHVLVLGHSLHDRPLVEALHERARKGRIRFACTFFGNTAEEAKLVTDQLKGTTLTKHDADLSVIPMDFHAESDFGLVAEWIRGGTVRADGSVGG